MWAYADDFDALEAAFEDDPTVERMTVLTEMDEERSYQMAWAGPIEHLIIKGRSRMRMDRRLGGISDSSFRITRRSRRRMNL